MILVGLLGIILFPKQYGVPSPGAYKEYDEKRSNIYQELILEKTSDEVSSNIKASNSERVITKEEIQQQRDRVHNYNLQSSRSSGSDILRDRKRRGMTEDGRVTEESSKTDTMKRATAISKWVRTNVKRDGKE